MVEYKIVKYCRLCKERYVVSKGEAKKFYCDKCYARMNNPRPDVKKD
jgi:hypothetical protein